MWARVVEVMLACWLAMSPFIFRHPPDRVAFWATDLACAAVIPVLSLISFWHPLRRAHLGNIAVGAWLLGFGYLASPFPAPPALQNDLMVGFVLLMFAIIPSESYTPPEGWTKVFIKERQGQEETEEIEIGPTRAR